MSKKVFVRWYNFPRCDAHYTQSCRHAVGDRCTSDAPFHINGANYCRRHAKDAALVEVFGEGAYTRHGGPILKGRKDANREAN